jgi:hypothetical protein
MNTTTSNQDRSGQIALAAVGGLVVLIVGGATGGATGVGFALFLCIFLGVLITIARSERIEDDVDESPSVATTDLPTAA